MRIRKRYFLLGLVLIGWWGCRTCNLLEFRMSDSELIRLARRSKVAVSIHYRVDDGHVIRYLKAGSDSLPALVLLHGSPASLSAWRDIFTDSVFLRRYQVIAIDRPGYGYSDFGDIETDIRVQASRIRPLVDSFGKERPVILLGSSYGGTVAAQIAMDLPGKVEQLVLLSASLQPRGEKTYLVSYPMVLPLIKFLFPPAFRMSSEEKLAHTRELEGLKDWNKIKCDVVLIHGNRDQLIYYDNAIYARKMLDSASSVQLVTMNGKGHSIIFTRPDFIKKIFLQYLKR